MLDLTNVTIPINAIADEIDLIPKDSETVFLVVFKFENKSHGFVNINYLAVFDTYDQASEYIKHSPSFEYLTINEVKKNINKFESKVADYGVKIVYDIQKQQITKSIKGFFPIAEFDLPYSLYHKPERAYLVSTIMPADEVNMDQYAINNIISHTNTILDSIASRLTLDLSFMNTNPDSPSIQSVIEYDKRIIKLRVLGLEIGTVKVVNFISPYDHEGIQSQYKRYLEKGSSELNRLIHLIKSGVDRFL
jgi:hypothetical protein